MDIPDWHDVTIRILNLPMNWLVFWIFDMVDTPPKTNMSPEKELISVGNTSSNHWFSGEMLANFPPTRTRKGHRDIDGDGSNIQTPKNCVQRSRCLDETAIFHGNLVITPWKINMEPENDGLEDDFPFPC